MSDILSAQSRLTQKYQATIPRQVREELHLTHGDSIVFEKIESGDIVVKKALPQIDMAYYAALEQTLSEWNSPEDDEDFAHL